MQRKIGVILSVRWGNEKRGLKVGTVLCKPQLTTITTSTTIIINLKGRHNAFSYPGPEGRMLVS